MESSSIEIVQALPKDAVIVRDLLAELGYENSVEEVEERLRILADSEIDAVLIARIGDLPVGLVSLHLTPMLHHQGYVGRLTSLVVNQEYRGRGVGRALIATCADRAAAAGAERLEVTSGDARLEAHRFYRNHGFERQGQRFTMWLKEPEG